MWISAVFDGKVLYSNEISIKKGVPQGSVLGPLLYILYTNELPTISSEYMVMYADDTALIFSESDKEILLKRVIDNINTLTEYFNAYDLTLNIKKHRLFCLQTGRTIKYIYHIKGTI